jgi:predicted transcriptional regulator
VYRPTLPREEARDTALARMVRTFFDDSPGKTVAALLDLKAADLSAQELDELAALIEQAKKRGR